MCASMPPLSTGLPSTCPRSLRPRSVDSQPLQQDSAACLRILLHPGRRRQVEQDQRGPAQACRVSRGRPLLLGGREGELDIFSTRYFLRRSRAHFLRFPEVCEDRSVHLSVLCGLGHDGSFVVCLCSNQKGEEWSRKTKVFCPLPRTCRLLPALPRFPATRPRLPAAALSKALAS